jgi:hypothetical protein
VEVEAPKPIFYLVNFDLLLGGFLALKLFFLLQFTLLNEKLFNGQEDPENPVYLSEKKVYYVFPFLKVSQCKLKQKEQF